MPEINLNIDPTNYKVVSGKTWSITGLRVDNNFSSRCIFNDSTTESASGYYSSELGDNVSTGVYSTSGQFDNPDLRVSWNLIHPRGNEILGTEALRDPFFKSYEINIRNVDGTFKSGINFINNGSITAVDLISGGSGYVNPTVFVSGDGTGAAIEVKTLGTGTFSALSGFSNIGFSGYATGIHSVNVVSGGSGYTAANTKLVVSGEGNDAHTIGDMALPAQGGDGITTVGSGALVEVAATGFGIREGYHLQNYIDIPYDLNKDIFGGEGQRKFMVEVITNDFYDHTSTGRIIVDFPEPEFESVNIVDTKRGLSFGVTPKTGQVFENKIFEDVSLEKIEIHKSNTADFLVNTGDVFTSTLFHTFRPDNKNGEGKLSSLSEIDVPPEKFVEQDFFSGYFYKLVPYDKFGTGQILNIGTGIRIEKNIDPVDIPSGFRLITDQDKTVGTNIQGEVVTNTYLSWKKDIKFNTSQYEVTIEDDVEKDSYSVTLNPPQISGIDFFISGTGANRADFDEKSAMQVGPEGMANDAFDIFSPYSTDGIQWVDHTVFLDSEYLETVSDSISNVEFVEVPAGNISSGYLYFTGLDGKHINYAGSNSFSLSTDNEEPHALVARNINNEVIVEYEPRIKIPTKKDGSYNFKVRGINKLGEKSNYSNIVNFTASGAASHFNFDPLDTSLKLGGTGTISKSGPFVTTVGGSGISAAGTGVVAVGGVNNTVTGEFSALVGGSGNQLLGGIGNPAESSFLGGGRGNYVSGNRNALVGGHFNLVSGDGQSLLGGANNILFGSNQDRTSGENQIGNEEAFGFENSSIVGGQINTVSGKINFIGGGDRNVIGLQLNRPATINGGPIEATDIDTIKKISSLNVLGSAIAGGTQNQIFGNYNFIGGGLNNRIFEGSNSQKGAYSVILGGQDNTITGTATQGTSIIGGKDNVGAGLNAIVGGLQSTGEGAYSLAIGSYGWANHEGSFVLADGTEPAKVEGHRGHKKSLTAHSLNLFFENGTYVRNGDLYVSGDATVTGNLTVLGSFTLGDTTTDTLTSVGEIVTNDFVSGLSGYFGKVGIGSSTIDEDAVLQVTKPDVADPSRTEVARFLAITDAGNTNSSLRISSAVAGSQTSGRYVDLSVFDHNPTSRPLILQRDGGQVGIGTSIPDGAMLKVNGDASITGALRVDNNLLVADATNNRVGIGTKAPQNALDIIKSADGAATEIILNNSAAAGSTDEFSNIRFRHAGKTSAFIKVGRDADLSTTANTDMFLALWTTKNDSPGEKVRITSAGNVGIGVASPSALLHVRGTTSSPGALTIGTNRSTASAGDVFGTLNFGDSEDNTPAFIRGVADETYNGESTDRPIRLEFHTTPNSSATSAERMRITSAGKVGIGTTNPAELLTVSGANATVRINTPTTAGSDTAAFTFGLDGNADFAGMRLDYTDRTISGLALFALPAFGYPISITPSDGKDVFLNVMDGGKVGVGTQAPAATLQVNGDASITGELKVNDEVHISNNLVHKGDTDTFLNFNADRIRLNAGGVELIDAREAGTDYVAIGGLDDNGDVNFIVNSAVNGIDRVLEVDAGTSTVGINCDPLDAKGSALVVSGDASITGQLRTAGKVGIGDTAALNVTGPFHPIHVSDASDASILIDSYTDTVGTSAKLFFRTEADDSNVRVKGGIFFERLAGTYGNGIMRFAVDSAGDNNNVGIDDSKMVIDRHGNVLIGEGVGGQGAKLTVSGDASITGELRVGDQASKGITLSTRGSNRQQLDFVGTNTSAINAKGSLYINYDSDAGGSNDGIFFARNGEDEAGTVDVVIKEGKIGVGTGIPANNLEVVQSDFSDALAITLTRNSDLNSLPNTEISRIQFRGKYTDAAPSNIGAIKCETNSSAFRTDLDFFVKAVGGSEERGLILHGTSDGVFVGMNTADPQCTLQVNERGGESKLEVDPANQRIRLRDNVFISGGTTISGGAAAESGHLSVKGSGYFADGIVFGDGTTQTSASAGGGGGGAVSAVANGADNRVATFSSSDALNGEANLTFDGTNLTIGAAGADATRSLRIDGTNGSSETAGFIIKNNGENGRVEFQHNVGNGTPVPRMKLDNFGNLLIGDGVGSTQGAKLTVSGDASITGELRVAGEGEFATDLYVGDKIRHLGDSNTFLEFSNDLIYLKAGDINLLELREVGTDYVAVGGLASNTADVNFYVNTEVAGQDYAFVVDAGLPAVGINIDPNNAKGSALVVSGDTSITGELRVNRSGLFVGGNSNTNAIVGIGTTNPQFTLDVQFPNRISASAEYAWGLDLRRPGSTSRGLSFGAKQTADDWVIGSHNANIRLGHTFGTDAASMPKFYEDLSVFHQDAIHGGGKIAIGDFRGGTPQAKLVVSGDASISGELKVGDGTNGSLGVFGNGHDKATLQITNAGSSNARLLLNSNHGNWSVCNSDTVGDALEFRDESASSTRMIIDSAGKVGIGTNNPGSLLEVYEDDSSAGNTQLHIHNDKTDDAAVIKLEGKRSSLNDCGQVLFANNGNNSAAIKAFSNSSTQEGILTFSISAPGSADTVTEAMRINNTGNVGIGTTNPSEELEIYSTASAPVSAIIETNQDQEASLKLKNSQGEWEIKADNGADAFRIADVGTASRFSIEKGGEVGIGGTGQLGAQLTVHGDTSITGALRVAGQITTDVDVLARDVYISEQLIHAFDTDTDIAFTTDRIQFNAGGVELIDAREAGADYVAIGGLSTVSSDVNFFVNSAGAGGTDYAFAVDAGDSSVGININPVNAKGSALVVSGSASVTGELRTNGNLGVGAPNGGALLDPLHISAGNPRIRLEDTLDTNNYSRILADNGQLTLSADEGNNQASSAIIFKVDNGEVMRMNGANVGIGTTNPDGKLHIHTASAGSVTADTSSDDLVVENDNHGGISLLVPNDKASAITFGTPGDSIGAKIQWDNTNDAFDITTANNGAFIRFKTHDQTEAMRIDSDQKVGIGTTAPTGKLHIYQSGDSQPAFLVEGSQGSLFSVEDTLTGSLMSVNDIAGLPVFEAFDDGTIVMGQYNSGDLVVTGNKVGIGTSAPTSSIQVKGNQGTTFEFTDSSNRSLTDLGAGVLSWNAAAVLGSASWGGTADLEIDQVASSTRDILNVGDKFDVSPVKNQIRLRDNTYVSGSLFITGQEAIYLRTSASSTRIRSDNQINFLTEGGSAQMARFKKIQVSTNYSATADFNDNGIVFGTDANLFRSAANTLKTDGNLAVIGDLTVSGSFAQTSVVAETHVSGLSGYFGKVGIGSSSNPDNAQLYIAHGPTSVADVILESAAGRKTRLSAHDGTNFLHVGSASNHDFHIVRNNSVRIATSSTQTTVYDAGGDFFVLKDGKLGIKDSTPTATLQVNGDASITGELKVNGEIVVADHLVHKGDTDTYLDFTLDRFRFFAGNVQLIDAREAGSDYVKIGDAGEDVNFFVISAAAGIDNVLEVDAGSSTVGINCDPLDAKGSALVVSGDASITGELRVNDNVVIPDGNHFKFSPGGDTFIHGSSASDFIGAVISSEQFRIDSVATQVTGDLRVAEYIRHGGDDNTYQRFEADKHSLVVGGLESITTSTAGGGVTINEGGNDVNFRVESQSNIAAIFVDAATDLVGFGTSSPSASYRVTVNGGLAADFKSFIIDHPDPAKPDKQLAYASSETPEHNVFVRGKAQSKIIELPDHWPYLVHEDSISVQLTPIGEHQELYVESIKDNKILINNSKENKINCFYLVHAERKDIGKLEIEPDKSVNKDGENGE